VTDLITLPKGGITKQNLPYKIFIVRADFELQINTIRPGNVLFDPATWVPVSLASIGQAPRGISLPYYFPTAGWHVQGFYGEYIDPITGLLMPEHPPYQPQDVGIQLAGITPAIAQ
jgi:hypothetical protein